MKGFIIFVFSLVITLLFWIVSLEIKTNNYELELKQLTEYMQKIESKVDTDFDVLINKRWE